MNLETVLNKLKKITPKKKHGKYTMGVFSLFTSMVVPVDASNAFADNQENSSTNIYEEIDKLGLSNLIEKDQKKQQEDIYYDPCKIYDEIGQGNNCEVDEIEENKYDLVSNPYNDKMTQTENENVDHYYSQYCSLVKQLDITTEMKETIYVKVQNYLTKQILPDWRKFARETGLPDVDDLLQHLDHDYNDDTQKVEEFLKSLNETFPEHWIERIASSLYRMRKYASLQSITQIIDEEKRKYDNMLPQRNENPLTEKVLNTDENNIVDILSSIYKGAANISFLFEYFFKLQAYIKDEHKLLVERLELILIITDGNSIFEQEKYFYERFFHANFKLHSLHVCKTSLTLDDENLIMKSSCNVRNVKFTVPVRIIGWSPKNKIERLTIEVSSFFVEKDDFRTFFVPWIQLAEVLVLEIHYRTNFINDLCNWIQSSSLKRYEIDYDQLKFVDVTDLQMHFMKKQEIAVQNEGIKDEYSWAFNVCNKLNNCGIIKLKGEKVSISYEKKDSYLAWEFNV